MSRRIQWRLAESLLLAGPAPRWWLFERLYGEDEDGGPESGPNCLAVMLRLLQLKVRPIGVALLGEQRGDGPWYWAEPIEFSDLDRWPAVIGNPRLRRRQNPLVQVECVASPQ